MRYNNIINQKKMATCHLSGGACMKRDNSIYCLKRAKLIQLILTICMDLVFFILFLQKSFQAAISASPSLIYLCAAVWISIVSFLLFLLWDLTLLRSLSAKSRELNRLVYLDALTSIPNRHCLDGFLTDHISSSVLPTLGCCMLSISNLGMINTSLGRTAGDNALQDFSEILEKAGRSYGFVGRNNGNEFVLVTENASEEKMKQFLSSFEKEITSYNKSHTPIQFSSCYSLNQECCFTDLGELFAHTSNKLHHR
ncbi:GGDEF domain-containing protein [Lachnospiraceae bacterium OM04-12BH]|nr:GGDEF domain-containing protein [Lachnospiraceae bacterium OM04-12BH]